MQKKMGDDRLVFTFFMFLLGTFVMGAVYSGINLCGGFSWFIPGHGYDFYFLENLQVDFSSLLSFLFLAVAVILMFWLLHRMAIQNVLVLGGLAFVLSVLPRLFLLRVFQDIQFFSDFQHAWERANGDMASLDRYRIFPSYMNYSLYLRALVRMFGEDRNVVILWNILMNGLTSVGIYLTANKIYKRGVAAFLPALLYSVYLPSILYSLVATPEHITVLFNVWGIFFLCGFLVQDTPLRKCWYVLVAGFLFGIGNSMKTFFPIILIAFLLVLGHGFLGRRNAGLLVRLVSPVLLLVGTTVSGGLVLGMTERVFSLDLDNGDATPHFLAVGLNREGEGQIHLGNVSRLYVNSRMAGTPRREAALEVWRDISNDWRGHASEIIPFLVRKTIWAWQDDCIPVTYFLTSEGINPRTGAEIFVFDFLRDEGSQVAQTMYFVLLVLSALSCILVVLARFHDPCLILNCLLIEGYFFLMLISESQSRYKCLIMPFVFVLVGCIPYYLTRKEDSR